VRPKGVIIQVGQLMTMLIMTSIDKVIDIFKPRVSLPRHVLVVMATVLLTTASPISTSATANCQVINLSEYVGKGLDMTKFIKILFDEKHWFSYRLICNCHWHQCYMVAYAKLVRNC